MLHFNIGTENKRLISLHIDKNYFSFMLLSFIPKNPNYSFTLFMIHRDATYKGIGTLNFYIFNKFFKTSKF